MTGWFEQTFSSAAGENDLIKSRALNTTRIASVLIPVLGGIWTAISEFADKRPFNEPNFQKVLIVAGMAFVAVILVADMLARAITAGRAVSHAAIATTLPAPIVASRNLTPPDRDVVGKLIAFRASNADEPTTMGEYLFIPNDAAKKSGWVRVTELDFG